MSEKIYFSILILCGFLCKGKVQVFSENVEESNSLDRRKRVINLEEGGDVPVPRGVAPYVVNIKENPSHVICVGSILSKYTVITVATCVVRFDVAFIKIYTGSAYSTRGNEYNVREKKLLFADHPVNTRDGIALLIIESAIIFNNNVGPIAFHQGPLLANTPATIFGWGYNLGGNRGTNYRLRLRSITIPIMNHRECVNIYRNRAVISDKHICTYHPNKRSGHSDPGAPLVVNNHLAGLYIWSGTTPGLINPDVFLIAQDLQHSQWIRNNIVHNI